MRAFISGANGFIGSQLARRLVKDGVDVHALIRPESDTERIADIIANVHVVYGDLLRPEQGWLTQLGEINPDTCFHFAWYAEPGVFLTSPLNLQYLAASLHLAEGVAKAGCKKLVIAGSFSEYDQDLGYLTEDSALRPNTPYGAAKVALYQALAPWATREGIELVWPRIFSVYGPGEDEKRFVPAVILAALKGETTRLTPGEQLRDYQHVADAAEAVWAVVKSGITGAVNIGSGKPIAIGELAMEIGKIVGRPELIRLGDLPYRAGEAMFVCANTSRLQETGWRPRYDLQRGLEETIEWWRRRSSGGGRGRLLAISG